MSSITSRKTIYSKRKNETLSTPAFSRKLQYKEDDWKLDGPIEKKQKTTSAVAPLAVPKRRVPRSAPSPSRGIIELDYLKAFIEDNLVCACCHMCVEVTFASVMIATNPVVSCKRPTCVGPHNSTPNIEKTKFVGGHASGSEFATNLLCALAFMVSGDGGAEAERLLGFMGWLMPQQ